MQDWQRYVDDDLIGSGKITRAVIVELGGGILAASPGYTLHPEEQRDLSTAFQNLTRVQNNGIRLVGQKFFVLQATDTIIYAKKQADGVNVVKTKQTVIAAEYAAPTQPMEAAAVLHSLAEQLVSAGH